MSDVDFAKPQDDNKFSNSPDNSSGCTNPIMPPVPPGKNNNIPISKIRVIELIIHTAMLVVTFLIFNTADKTYKKLTAHQVRPFLSTKLSIVDNTVTYKIENVGLGPAIINDVVIVYEKKQLKDSSELLEKMGFPKPKDNKAKTCDPIIEKIRKGDAIKVAGEVEMYTLSSNRNCSDDDMRKFFSNFIEKTEVRISYCSFDKNCYPD